MVRFALVQAERQGRSMRGARAGGTLRPACLPCVCRSLKELTASMGSRHDWIVHDVSPGGLVCEESGWPAPASWPASPVWRRGGPWQPGAIIGPALATCLKATILWLWTPVFWGQANVPSGNGYVAISSTYMHSLALRSDGSIVGWGCNVFGQANAPAGYDFKAIAAGGNFSLALKSDGSIVGWGSNGHGQLNVPAGNDFVAIAAGNDYGLALRADRTLAAWGNNAYGQLDVPAGLRAQAISANFWHSIALVPEPGVLPLLVAGCIISRFRPGGPLRRRRP